LEVDDDRYFGFDWNRASNNPRRLTEAGLREVLTLAF